VRGAQLCRKGDFARETISVPVEPHVATLVTSYHRLNHMGAKTLARRWIDRRTSWPSTALSFESIGVRVTQRPTLRPARAARKVSAHSLLFRSLSLASFPFVPWADGRFPWVARRRTNTACLRDRALSRSRSAILRGGCVVQPKLTESRKHHARSPQTTACRFPTMSVAVSPRSALSPHAPPAATLPRRLGSRPGCYWP
jgi:hypothetical protein